MDVNLVNLERGKNWNFTLILFMMMILDSAGEEGDKAGVRNKGGLPLGVKGGMGGHYRMRTLGRDPCLLVLIPPTYMLDDILL